MVNFDLELPRLAFDQICTIRLPERSRGTSSSEAENCLERASANLDFARPSPSTSLGKSDSLSNVQIGLNTKLVDIFCSATSKHKAMITIAALDIAAFVNFQPNARMA